MLSSRAASLAVSAGPGGWRQLERKPNSVRARARRIIATPRYQRSLRREKKTAKTSAGGPIRGARRPASLSRLEVGSESEERREGRHEPGEPDRRRGRSLVATEGTADKADDRSHEIAHA